MYITILLYEICIYNIYMYMYLQYIFNIYIYMLNIYILNMCVCLYIYTFTDFQPEKRTENSKKCCK